MKTLGQLSRELPFVAGLVEESADHRFFNSAIYFEDGEIRHVHRKVYLPTYGMFDEQRYFARGDRVRAFDSKFGRLTLLICEDLWHPSTIYLGGSRRRAGGAVPFGEPAARHRRGTSSRRQRALLGDDQSNLRRDLQPLHDLRQPLRHSRTASAFGVARRSSIPSASDSLRRNITTKIFSSAKSRSSPCGASAPCRRCLRDEDIDLTINELMRIRERPAAAENRSGI